MVTRHKGKATDEKTHQSTRNRDQEAVEGLGPLFEEGTKPVKREELELGDMFEDDEPQLPSKKQKRSKTSKTSRKSGGK